MTSKCQDSLCPWSSVSFHVYEGAACVNEQWHGLSNTVKQQAVWLVDSTGKLSDHWNGGSSDWIRVVLGSLLQTEISWTHSNIRACMCNYTPRTTKLLGGYTGFTPSVRPSVRPSVCPSVRLSVRPSVRPSRMPCPLCIIYSYGWILFILGTNDHYHERVCRAPWPLTLTYIFKVIRPWLRKSCPLCSVYSSGWIISILGTNDHYH